MSLAEYIQRAQRQRGLRVARLARPVQAIDYNNFHQHYAISPESGRITHIICISPQCER